MQHAVLLTALALAGCAEAPQPPVASNAAQQVWTRAPTSRLPDSSIPVQHVRGSTYRAMVGGSAGRPSGFGAASSGTFQDLTPVRR